MLKMAGIKNIMIKQAVILAGGLGMRLRPLTLKTPKPMLPIHNKPFLEYLLEIVRENGLSEVILLVGFRHEKIKDYFGDGKKFGLKIKYSYSPITADTGTRLRNAYKLLDHHFLLLYGDNIWPLHLTELLKNYQKKNKKAQVVIYSNFDNSRKNNMCINNKGLVTLYDKTRKSTKANGVDIGFYILGKSIIGNLPQQNCSFEETALPRLIAEKQLVGFITHHKYYSLTNIERLKETERYLAKK